MRIRIYTNSTQIRATLTLKFDSEEYIIKETHIFLNLAEQAYDDITREGLAVSHALVDFFHYVENQHFIIISHNPNIMELNWANYGSLTLLDFDVHYISLN